MRICVYGAGAIGGNFATRLAAAGNEVSVVVRGAHLAAIRADGLTLQSGDKTVVAKVEASDNAADLGPKDAVLVTLKSSGQRMLPDAIGPLLRAPLAFARKAVLDTPTLDAIEAICVQLATSKGLYRGETA